MSNCILITKTIIKEELSSCVKRCAIAIIASLISTCAIEAQSTISLKGGGEMYYEDTGGDKEVVLLLHGHTLDHRMWDSQVDVLKDNYRVIVPDLRGYGKSDDPAEGFQFTHADDAANFGPGNGLDTADVFSVGFGVSLIWVYYAYSGWNAAAYIVDDIKNPQRNVPLALIISSFFVMILYLALNMIFLRTAPAAELSGEVEVGLISANHIFGKQGGAVMGMLIALMLTSSISSMIYVEPRVSHTMGEDYRMFGFLTWRNKRNCPSIAVALQWLISMALIITDSFKEVTEYTGIVLSFCSMLTVAGVFVHRHRFPNAEHPYKTLGYPITPLLFCLVILCSIAYLVYQDFTKVLVYHSQTVPWTTIASGATLVVGWLLWFVANAINRRHANKAYLLNNDNSHK